MQVSFKLVYIFILKQIISLTEAIQYSFWCIWLNNVKIYLQFTFVDLKFSLELLCTFIHYLPQQKFMGHLFGPLYLALVIHGKQDRTQLTFHLAVKKSVWWICECYRISKIIYVLVEFSLKELEDSWRVNQDRNGDHLVQ